MAFNINLKNIIIMKKILLMAAAVAFTFSANAQFTDNLDSYSTGPLFEGNWTTWDGMNDGDQNIVVTTDEFFSAPNSGNIGPEPGPQDAVLDFPGDVKTSGTWSVGFKMLINAGDAGYFNLQGNVNPNANANQEFTSNNVNFVDGTMRINPGTDVNVLVAGSVEVDYPTGDWFDVVSVVDLDALTYEISVNGVSSGVLPVGPENNFGGVDFYASIAENNYYIDDVVFVEGLILATNDFAASNFSVYPNPVQDRLNISSVNAVSSVVVYDVLGKVVLTATPGVVSPSIDMSALTSGAYLVNITIDGTSKTVKVIK